jgi:glycosyltransferase involved in cell wall biosynthesis
VLPASAEHLAALGLVPGRYVLQVSRLVAEKRQLDLITAYEAARLPAPWKLVLVGGLDDSEYCRRLSARATQAGVVMAGFRTGEALNQLYANAGLFVLPSSHEGLPIALLEALSYALPVVASDIPANLELGLPPDIYVPLGDTARLAERIRDLAKGPRDSLRWEGLRDAVLVRYDWDEVARQTFAVYQRVMAR